jgi:FkbM family methyltransferase
LTDPQDYLQGRRFILTDLIHERGLLQHPLVICDIGARNALADSKWTAFPRGMVQLHGFEPDDAECASMTEQARAAGYDFRYHAIALARATGPVTFHRFAEETANSIFPANTRLIERWCYNRSLPLSDQFRLRGASTIDALSLADWAQREGIAELDFLKLNVQGGELEILEGAGPLLDGAVALILEQTFMPTYLGAPLFGEVFEFMRRRGFSMFDIVSANFVGRTRSPIHITDDRIFRHGTGPKHQLFEGHFLYFRDPILLADRWSAELPLSVEKCIRLVALAEVLGQLEFAFELLGWLADSPDAGAVAGQCRDVSRRGADQYRALSQGRT